MEIDFDLVRPIFGGRMSKSQVAGVERIVAAFDRYGNGDKRFLAYQLATDKIETAHTMQPVKETYNARYDGATQPEDAKVIRRLNDAKRKGRLKTDYWSAGWFGRGDVQLTHEYNYQGEARAAVLAEFNVDIHATPALVLRPDISAFILIRGTIGGWFTGKKLSTYITATKADFKNARRTVNGTDRAAEIAELAEAFLPALSVPTEPQEPAPAPQAPAKPANPPADDPAGKFELSPIKAAIWGILIVGVIVVLNLIF